MTKVKTPLLSFQGTGTIGNQLTFQRHPKGIKVYPYKKHADAKSTDQLVQRNNFETGKDNWNTFSQAEKDEWSTKAGTKFISGYHAYLSYWLLIGALIANLNPWGSKTWENRVWG